MLGGQRAGVTGSGSNHNRKSESQLGTAAGRTFFPDKADECGVILSKSSIPLVHDPSAIVDFFDGGVSSSILRSRSSSSYLGEPATPNGAGEVCCAHSPLSSSSQHTRRGYNPCGRASLDTLAENPGDGHNFTRRSCSFGRDEVPECGLADGFHHSAPMLALRQSNIFNTVQSSGPGGVTRVRATGEHAAASFWESALANSDSRMRQMERLLKDKCVENEVLLRQLKERDQELAELRAELSRLRTGCDKAGSAGADKTPGAKSPPGLLAQLQRARDRLCSRQQSLPPPAPATPGGPSTAAAENVAAGPDHVAEVIAPPNAAVPLPLMPLCALLDSGVGIPEDDCTALIRLDTPELYDALNLKPKASVLTPPADPALPVAAAPLDSAGLEPITTAAAPVEQGPAAHPGPIPTCCCDDANASLALSLAPAPAVDVDACEQGTGQAAASFPSAGPAPPSGLGALVSMERLRTDRAHAALLFSSRQAHRLSQQLLATRAHAAALHEELRDWRSACLDNHRRLARLRRAMAAASVKVEAEMC